MFVNIDISKHCDFGVSVKFCNSNNGIEGNIMNKRIAYYYCSLATFQNIIKNNSIYLSDPLKMNDSSEVKWALKLFKKNPFLCGFFDKLGYGEDWNKLLSKFNYYRDYKTRICCFSKTSNLLSQWRAYADQGCGLSIGFDLDKLTEGFDNLGISDIDYSEKSINGDTVKGVPLNQYTDILSREGCNFDEIIQELLPVFLTYKSPYFSEENEVRLIYQENSIIMHFLEENAWTNENGEVVKFIELKNDYRLWNNDAVIKYSELKFSKDAIHSVWIGPKCKLVPEEVISMIQFYFKTDEPTLVKKSKIDLR